MSFTQSFPLRMPVHRRMALALGLRLVSWAHAHSPQHAHQSADSRERALRRYRVARQVQLERERAVANALRFSRRVL